MKTITAFVLMIIPATVVAQIYFDTLSVRPVGPGATHKHLVAPSVPWNMNILEITLTNPFISVETVKAQDRLAGYERTSMMAARRTFPGHTIIGGVNGDFYSTGGIPTNMQIRDGEVLRLPINRSTIGFDSLNNWMLNIVNFSGGAFAQSGSRAVQGVNQTRGTDQMILYNKYLGASTGTNQFGAEALLAPVGQWFANDTVRCVVENRVDGVGNMTIVPGKAVLSGHGTARSYINTMAIGDTVRLYLRVYPGLNQLKELLGGFPKIIFNGANYVDQGYIEEGGPSHTYERHPRTAVGVSADGSRFFLVTVDGRQTISAGMTLHELADFMVGIGVHTAVNLDGGGSTTMVVRNTIVNFPSDGGGERAVANALLVASSAPQGPLHHVLINPKKHRIFKGESVRFAVAGVDSFGNPVSLDSSLIQFSADPDIGMIDSTGFFTAGQQVDSGFVMVTHGTLSDSAFVVVKSISRIDLRPSPVVTDTTRIVSFRPRAFDPDGIEKNIPLAQYVWTSTNTVVGTIDSIGRLRGLLPGSTEVIARYEEARDTALVDVEVGVGTVVIDSMETLTGWSLSGINIDTTATTLMVHQGIGTAGSGSFKVDYRFTYNPVQLSFVQLNTNEPVFGIPDSIILDLRVDTTQHRVFYYIKDDDGETFKIFSNRYVNQLDGFDSLRTNMRNPVPVTTGAIFNYPVTLTRIEIQLGSSRIAGTQYTGTIHLDNLRIKYPATITSVSSGAELPGEYRLYQNYPNPFNPSTSIIVEVPGGNRTAQVELAVFDILGREIDVIVDGRLSPGRHRYNWSPTSAASGVYFYRLSTPGRTIVRKMVLLR